MPDQRRLYVFGGLSAKPSNDLWMVGQGVMGSEEH